MIKRKPVRVVVAMSGGVDSAVSAALMAKKGYEVIGITLQLYDSKTVKDKACCAIRDIYDARAIASKLNIEHLVLDTRKLFKSKVIDYFIKSYLDAETPIPCVKCNQFIKFDYLLDQAKQLKADALITGHYVRKVLTQNKLELHSALDKSKDQSYFLFTLKEKQLDFLSFPLGDISKTETRKLARELGLVVSNKPASQDICFINEGKYREIIEQSDLYTSTNGKIVHVNGNVLGSHKGIINYTIGQRRGLGVHSFEPLYVVSINKENNNVIVGPYNYLTCKKLLLRNITFINGDGLNISSVEVKLRSTHNPIKAKLEVQKNNTALVFLESPEYGIAPGQACVFYDKSKVLGGGWIDKICFNEN